MADYNIIECVLHWFTGPQDNRSSFDEKMQVSLRRTPS